MTYHVEQVTVWAATIDDTPGELAGILSALSHAGANLDSIIARRTADHPGKAVVFVTPLRSDHEIDAAAQVGFNVTQTLYSVRVQGPNTPGATAHIVQAIAETGINLRGFSAATVGTQLIAYAAVDSLDDANKVASVLR